MFYQF